MKPFERLLSRVLTDDVVTDPRQRAYMLATVKHETDRRWYTRSPDDIYLPCEEIGRGKGTPYGETRYWGRGFVQLTWEANYRKFGELLGIDLVHNPDLALEWDHAYAIMSVGMSRGLFTGKKLGDYFNGNPADPFNARRIINGTDKADQIVVHYVGFESMLRSIAKAA